MRLPFSLAVERATESISKLRGPHPIRVAVDGRTAAGKTTFADQLGDALRNSGRTVIRASVDGFHNPAAIRRRQGRLSPDGYYEDARDIDGLRRILLDPLGPGGTRSYAVQSFDLEHDLRLEPQMRMATDDVILIVDGTFLQRPELNSAWDFVIFLDVSEPEARRRGVDRDEAALGGRQSAEELYLKRYGPAFERYCRETKPEERADIIVDVEGALRLD